MQDTGAASGPTDRLKKTPLYEWHSAHGARIVDFSGWLMPVQYSSIVEEHKATRSAVGLFDISHMARFRFEGEGTATFLDHLLTRRVVDLSTGKIRYALVTNEAGGILDDVLVYRLEEPGGAPFHLLVVNAGNRDKIAGWIKARLDGAPAVEFRDQTEETAMIAVQGPAAFDATAPLVKTALGDLNYYTGLVCDIAGQRGIVSRTGYTGEDGYELILPAQLAMEVWQLLQSGKARGLPVGLGARDTLRLEAAMPLYGHELSESINPYQAGLGFAVQLKGRDFIGSEALRELKNKPDQERRVGMVMTGRRVPREHYTVHSADAPVGKVTSGTFSPTLERPIAMAYVRPEVAAVGTELAVEIRGKREPAQVVQLPFYSR